MGNNRGKLRLNPRLRMAMELGGRGTVAAYIGCDHGLLSCALLEEERFSKVIASDISAPSLKKCRDLAALRGIASGMEFRVGNGLACLQEGEADTVFLLGMGGTLIARILEETTRPLAGAIKAVLSPMAGPGIGDLRAFLYENGYRVQADRLVREEGRLYQLFCVLPPLPNERDPLPEGWPEDCFELGYRAFSNCDPLFSEALAQRISAHTHRLNRAKNSPGEAVLREHLMRLEQIQKMMEDIR